MTVAGESTEGIKKPVEIAATEGKAAAQGVPAKLDDSRFIFNQKALNFLQTTIVRSLTKFKLKHDLYSHEYVEVLRKLGVKKELESQEVDRDTYISEFQIIVAAFNDAISSYPGEIHDDMAVELIKDLEPLIKGAIKREYEFDLIHMAEDFCEMSKFRFNPQIILGEFLQTLPTPENLSEESTQTLLKVIMQVEEFVPGTHERLKWEWDNQGQAGS